VFALFQKLADESGLGSCNCPSVIKHFKAFFMAIWLKKSKRLQVV